MTVRRHAILTFVAAGIVASVPEATLIQAQTPAPPVAACASTPDDAWKLAREAVATKDAGKVMMTLTPAQRTRNAIEYAVGASMVIGMSGFSVDESNKAQAAKVAAMEKSLNTELDALLTKHKALTIAKIGKPLLPRMEAPEVIAGFSKVDHVAYARDMEAFFQKISAAGKAAGLKADPPPDMGELVVGGGDLKAPLTGMKITGDTARAGNGKVDIKFAKANGCWFVDGNEMK